MEDLKTKTLAEIYLKQGHLQDAYEILHALAEKDPADGEIKEKLKELRETIRKLQPLQRWLAHIQNRREK
jgi:hypothetical protein